MEIETKAISVSNLYFNYNSSFCIEDVSFDVAAGKFTGILGPNGSGKTTLLNILNGHLRNYSGKIKIFNSDISRMSSKEIAKKIALVPQKHTPVFPYLTREFIVMGRYPHLGFFSVPGKDDYEIAYSCACKTGIEKYFNTPYTELSGGEMQLVLLARALAQKPEILILDEPNLHLDFNNQFKVLNIVGNIVKSKGITAITTLHDPNYIRRFTSEIIMIENGKIIRTGNTEQVLDKNVIEKTYSMKMNVYRSIKGEELYFPEKESLR